MNRQKKKERKKITVKTSGTYGTITRAQTFLLPEL